MMQRVSEGDGTVDMPSKVRAWDLPTRLFHWLLAALVLFAWVSWRYSEALGDPALKLHRWNGHAILVLVAWRPAVGALRVVHVAVLGVAVVAMDGCGLRLGNPARAARPSTSRTTRSAPT
jgi:hypothetical protein